jgi:transposase-like protein
MSGSRRQFSKEFKDAAVRRLEMGASLAEVARACEVNPNVLHRWKRELHAHGVKAFAGNGKARAHENQIAELERKVGRQAMENDFLRRCLQYAEEQRRLQALTTRGSSTRTSKKK